MNLRANNQRHQAFTLPDAVLVVAMLAMLALVAAMLLPALARPKRVSRLHCVNFLMESGIAFEIWRGDHGDKYPMDVPAAQGGAQELTARGDVAACFQVMSNEFSVAKMLTCPDDARHKATTNWNSLSRTNLSYFIGLNVSYQRSRWAGAADANQSFVLTSGVPPGLPNLLSGDANLVQNGREVAGGFLNPGANTPWTPERHQGVGNILLTDGSVQTVRQIGFTHSTEGYSTTNTVVIP
jgi:prepilin-type processing-associated H-X9-DG protein